MPRSTVDIIIDAEWKGNNAATRAEQSIRDIGDAADKAERQSSGFFQGLIQGAGQQAFGLITDKIGDATRAVIEFGQESIAVAGTVGETTSLLQTSLGPAYEDFVDDVDAVSDATGRSALKFQEAVSPILAMQRSMGFAQDQAGELSVAFGQAALDLESFFNTSTGFEDIQGALAGSSETLQKYGIDVRETTLQNRALELGLIDTRDEYDRQVRSLVILEEIQRQAADAMGDAARTADSAVNKQRAYEDAIFDLKAAIGEELLPVQEALTDSQLAFVEKVGPELVNFAGLIRDIALVAQDAAKEIGSLFGLLPDSGLSYIDAVVQSNSFLFAIRAKALELQVEEAEQAAKQRQTEELFSATAGAVTEYASALEDAAVAHEGLTDVTGDYVTEADREAAALRLLKTAREQAFSADDIRNRSRRIGFEDFAEGIRAADFFAKVIEAGNQALRVTPELAKEAGERVRDELTQANKDFSIKFTADLEDISGLQRQAQELGEAFSAAAQGVNGQTLDELLFEVGKQAGVAGPALGQLAFQTGNYTTEAINAALESAAMAIKIEELAGKVADGEINLYQAGQELANFRGELETGRQSRLDMIEDTSFINQELDKIEGDRTATVDLTVTGLNALERAAQLIANLPSVTSGSVQLSASGFPLPGGNDQPGLPGNPVPSTVTGASSRGINGQQ